MAQPRKQWQQSDQSLSFLTDSQSGRQTTDRQAGGHTEKEGKRKLLRLCRHVQQSIVNKHVSKQVRTNINLHIYTVEIVHATHIPY